MALNRHRNDETLDGERTSTREAVDSDPATRERPLDGRHASYDDRGTAYDDRVHDDRVRDERVREDRVREDELTPHERAHSRFGGTNWGAVFFGWLVAIAVTILLSSIVAAVATALGVSTNLTQSQAQRDAGTVGIAAAITVVVVLVIGYYAGGYVSGRMSRFDGGRQGFGVWLLGLVVTILAVVIGAVFGSRYNVLDRVDLPRIPIPTDAATVGGIITGVVVLLGTLLFAVLGGKAGRRYHDKVDRVLRP